MSDLVAHGRLRQVMRGDIMNYVTVGSDHKLQKSDSKDTGLKDLLSQVLQNNDVVLIAEEVETSKPVTTFGLELIGKDKWLSIDMDDDERKKAGIYNTLLHSGAPVRDPRNGRRRSAERLPSGIRRKTRESLARQNRTVVQREKRLGGDGHRGGHSCSHTQDHHSCLRPQSSSLCRCESQSAWSQRRAIGVSALQQGAGTRAVHRFQ